MATLVTIHGVDEAKLAGVMAEMATLGSPTLRAVEVAGVYYLLEGTHRATAASRLGLPIELELIAYNADEQGNLRVSSLGEGLDCDNTCEEIIGNPRGSLVLEAELAE